MRRIFGAYYATTDTDTERLWNTGVIILDAMTLVGFSRYSRHTADALFDILESVHSALWIPREVGRDFHRTWALLGDDHAHVADRRRTFSRIGDLFTDRVGRGFIADDRLRPTVHGESPAVRPSRTPSPEPGRGQSNDVVWREILRHGRETHRPAIFVTATTDEHRRLTETDGSVFTRAELGDLYWEAAGDVIQFSSPAQFFTVAAERAGLPLSDLSRREIRAASNRADRTLHFLALRRAHLEQERARLAAIIGRERDVPALDSRDSEFAAELARVRSNRSDTIPHPHDRAGGPLPHHGDEGRSTPGGAAQLHVDVAAPLGGPADSDLERLRTARAESLGTDRNARERTRAARRAERRLTNALDRVERVDEELRQLELFSDHLSD